MFGAIDHIGIAVEDIGAVARRRAHARFLDSALTGVIVPYTEPGVHHLYRQYTVRVPGNGRPDRAPIVTSRNLRPAVILPRITATLRNSSHGGIA